MHRVSGGCHCGNIRVDADLPRTPDTYRPRACDCEFCLKHGASYISDAQGSMSIRIKDERKCVKYRQGSKAAQCLLCSNCGVLVAILHESDDRLYGTLNVKSIDGGAKFLPIQSVSPKKLSDRERVRRWHDIWFANVSVTNADA